MQTERRVTANPQTKPTYLGCEFADNCSYHPHSPSPFIIIITEPKADTYFTVPLRVEG